MDTESQLSAGLISTPYFNADLCYVDKNGTPQLQPLKTTSVFADDLKARNRNMDSEGQLSIKLISNPYSNVDLGYGTQAIMEHPNCSLI
jgi:hypothetical protein